MENSSNAETYALTPSGYAPGRIGRPPAARRRPTRRNAPDGMSGALRCGWWVAYCSTCCGVSVFSCAWMTGELSSVATSILRGLAFSLTGIVTLSTPLL